jgi:hypothetical protein
MAQSRYCSSCGSRNDYVQGIAPTKCKSCSKPLSAVAFQAPTSPKKLAVPVKAKYYRKDSEEIELEEDIYFETPSLARLEVTVSVPRRLTIAQLQNGAEIASLDKNISE